MELMSNAFDDNGFIPDKYRRDKQNISPPLNWSGEPQGTKTFAISMIDIDAYNFIHWEILNIPSNVHSIKEGASKNLELPGEAEELANSAGTIGYAGPMPPIGSEPHRYVFTLYALTKKFEPFSDGPLEDLIKGKILTSVDIVAYAERKAQAA
jgi:Raf kinase inhibitor-like YbhB/YbcL family protein